MEREDQGGGGRRDRCADADCHCRVDAGSELSQKSGPTTRRGTSFRETRNAAGKSRARQQVYLLVRVPPTQRITS